MQKLSAEFISFLVAVIAIAFVIFGVAGSSLMSTFTMIGLPLVIAIVQIFLAVFNGRRHWISMFPCILGGFLIYMWWVSDSSMSFTSMPFLIAEGLWIGIFAVSIEAVFAFLMHWASFKPAVPADEPDPVTDQVPGTSIG